MCRITTLEEKDVRLNFQKRIASSQTTLPITCGVAFLFWFVQPSILQPTSFSTPDYGLWQYVPTFFLKGYWPLSIGAFWAAVTVYLMAELNNAHVLLRVNSRMLSSTLAILLGLIVMTHNFQPGTLVMLLSLLTLFPLFSSYQRPIPLLTFLTYLPLSVASLFFPKLLWLVPVYWIILAYFRAISFRCFLSSILATLVPYWIYAGISVLTGTLPAFLMHTQAVVQLQRFDYSTVSPSHIFTYSFILLLFITGAIDFYIHQFLDKTRVRIIYNTAIIYGLSIIIWIGLQPQYLPTLLPLLLLCTSILFGHFFTLTHTKFSHIYCIILMMFAVMLLVIQYLPPNILFPNF